jgi:hypothetical protein
LEKTGIHVVQVRQVIFAVSRKIAQIGCGYHHTGADPGFQVRGGVFKKIVPSGGRSEHFWGISCGKSQFYAKKSYFFQF